MHVPWSHDIQLTIKSLAVWYRKVCSWDFLYHVIPLKWIGRCWTVTPVFYNGQCKILYGFTSLRFRSKTVEGLLFWISQTFIVLSVEVVISKPGTDELWQIPAINTAVKLWHGHSYMFITIKTTTHVYNKQKAHTS